MADKKKTDKTNKNASQQEKVENPVVNDAEPKTGAEGTATGGASAADVAALEEKLAQAVSQQDAIKEQLLRTTAEYENFRRRSREEHDAAFSNGVAHAVNAILSIVDILEAAAQAPTTDEEYKKGVLLTLAKTQEVFNRLGIKEIEAQGLPFDPELHNACMQDECEGIESGCVSKVVQKGYTLNDRVIRHSMVAVVP